MNASTTKPSTGKLPRPIGNATALGCGLLLAWAAAHGAEDSPNFLPWEYVYTDSAFLNANGPYASAASAFGEAETGYEGLWDCPAFVGAGGVWAYNGYLATEQPGAFLAIADQPVVITGSTNPPDCNNNQGLVSVTLRKTRGVVPVACDPGFNGPFPIAPNGPWIICRDDEQNYFANPLMPDCPPVAGNPCELTTGTKIERAADYSAPGIEFYRTFRSNMFSLELNRPDTYGQILGKNWAHNFESRLLFDVTTPTHWVNADGAIAGLFEIEPDVYIAANGSAAQLRPVDPLNPSNDWVLYLPSGRKERYRRYCQGLPLCHAGYYLEEIHDPSGNITHVNYAQLNGFEIGPPILSVTGPHGHSLQFEYASISIPFAPAVTSLDYILDPAGEKIDFIHDVSNPSAAGDFLRGVRYQDQQSVSYLYEDNTPPPVVGISDFFVRGIVDENGVEFATFEYYDAETGQADLRVKSTQHGAYEWTGFEYAYTGESATVTDAAGNETEYLFQPTPGLDPYDWEPNWLARNPDTITGPDNYASSQENEPDGQRRITQSMDENGIITRFEYDDYHLISKKENYLPGDPPTWSRKTTYQYLNDTSDLKTLVREPSVACPGQFRETVTTYVPGTQWVEAVTVMGYKPAECGTRIGRTITYSDFNVYGQPQRIDGPRVNPNDPADTGWDATDVDYYVTDESGEDCATAGGARCGQLKSITNALGHVTTFDEYDAHGRLTKMTDPNGLVTTYRYTLRGQTDTITRNDGMNPSRTIDYIYDAVGQIDFIGFPEGLTLDLEWNDAHLLEYIEDAAGNRIEYGYDARGNRTSENLRGASTGSIERALTMSYDARNRPEWIRQGSSNKAHITFDAVGNLDDVTDPNSNTLGFGSIVTDYRYDGLNRLDKIIDALNGAANPADYDFDEHDNLTSVRAPNGAETEYVYDDLGNLLAEKSPDRGTTLYAYDAAGNMTCKADGRHVTSQTSCDSVPGRWIYAYDALSRVESIDYTSVLAGNPEVDYVYDGANEKGRLDAVKQWHQGAGVVETQYDYDLFGSLTEQRQYVPGSPVDPDPYTTSYKYDGNDRLAEITYPSGRIVNYERDAAGQIRQVESKSPVDGAQTSIVLNVLRKPFGPPRTIMLGNGISSSRIYDTAYRVIQTDLIDGLSPVDSHVYAIDDAGNVTQDLDVWESSNTADYAYDALHRLVNDTSVETEPGNTYVYDANGNRESRIAGLSEFPAQTIDYVANSNRMSFINSSPVGYDGAGNVTDGYHYDFANRLGRIDWNSESMSIVYNGAGELARTIRQPPCNCGSCPPAIRQYYHFGPDGLPLGMVDVSISGNRVERDWVWLDGIPVAQIQESYTGTGIRLGTQTIYLHADHLGTPRTGTDENGEIKWKYQSDAFGFPLVYYADVNVPLRMPGQLDYSFGPAGMFYNYYRDYDANTGRYLESDPIGLAGGLNMYAYVYGNPLRLSDPYGLDILLQTHHVALGFDHAKITIIPNNQAGWINDPRFNNVLTDGRRYLTIGAGPKSGDLIGNLNRARDIQLDRNETSNRCVIPSQYPTEDDLIRALLAADQRYRDNLDYEYFPQSFTDGYNSNSYVSGLLRAVGIRVPSPPNTPGFDKPLPADAFR